MRWTRVERSRLRTACVSRTRSCPSTLDRELVAGTTWRRRRTGRQGARQLASGGKRFGRRNTLVILQVALSVVLLVAAGLFLRTLTNLGALDLGFDREHVVTLRLEPRGSNQKSQNEPRLRQIYGLILENVERLPGVRAVSLAGGTPLSNENPLNLSTISNSATPPREQRQIRMMQV